MTPDRLAELSRLLQLGAWLNREQAMELVAEVRECWRIFDEVRAFDKFLVRVAEPMT